MKKSKGNPRFNSLSCKLLPSSKHSQSVFGLSFSVIFSIILIVFIIVIGIIVARAFLGWGECSKLKLFVDDFKNEIDRAYNSDGLSFDFDGLLSSEIEQICFFNSTDNVRGQWETIGFEINVYDDENMIFYPLDVCAPAHKIAHLDIGEVTRFDNPKCFGVINGKVKFRIEKKINKGLVEVR